MVLIDDDAPLLDVIVDEKLNAVRIFMRNFYAPLKNCDPTCGLCSSPALPNSHN